MATTFTHQTRMESFKSASCLTVRAHRSVPQKWQVAKPSVPPARSSRQICSADSPPHASSSRHASSSQQGPWQYVFDLRERETLWTPQYQARLVQMVASYTLGWSMDEVEAKLEELVTLLPDLGSKISRLKPVLLAALLADTSAVAHKLILLRSLMPRANVSAAAAALPDLLLWDDDALTRQVAETRLLLGDRLEEVVHREPRMLDAEAVAEVLAELQRLFGQGPEHARLLLVKEPSWLLRVERGPKRLGPHPDDPC